MFGFCECSRVSSELRCLLHDPRCCIYTWLKSLTLKSLRWRAWSANRATLQCIMMCHQKVPQRSMANLSVYHCPWPPFRAVQTTLALGGSPVVPQRSKRDKLAPRHSAEGYPSQLLEGRHTLKPWTGPATPTSQGSFNHTLKPCANMLKGETLPSIPTARFLFKVGATHKTSGIARKSICDWNWSLLF